MYCALAGVGLVGVSFVCPVVEGCRCPVYRDEAVAAFNRRGTCVFKDIRAPKAVSAAKKVNPLKASKKKG